MSDYQKLLRDFKKILKQHDQSNKCNKMRKDINIIIYSTLLWLYVLLLGSIGYYSLFDMDWLEAIYSATVNATGLQVEPPIVNNTQKIFVIIFSIVSIVILLAIANTAINRIFDMYVNT
jgi:hypothetical protein